MCWIFKKKYHDGAGTIKPEKGIVVFPDNEGLQRIRPELAPQWIRLAVDQGCNFSNTVNWIRHFRNVGIRVILCLWDKGNIYNTPDLAVKYARLFEDDVVYELGNEPNSNIAPINEPNSYVASNIYVKLFNDFRMKIKTINSNALVIIGGLNNQVKKRKKDQIPTWNYIEEFVRLGGKTDWWNFHQYSLDDKFYRMLEICNKLDKNKPIILGEFPARTKDEFKFWMDKATKNSISVAVIYSWASEEQFAIYKKPDLINYIKNY